MADNQIIQVTAVSDLIDALGGFAPAANALKTTVPVLRVWKTRNTIPAIRFADHSAILTALGIKFARSLWRQQSTELLEAS